ncbi:hypothetical protein AAG570_009956 [Ranatra chinensis]|uniref:Bridge-like lipid transfer protein family member 1 C-terminal domain-containing protein n=1 Tax=Ranatra chinensis TaxID=642074 RepID=A0ABD0Z1E8_9HEMI
MEQVTSTGVTASKIKFIIDLPRHSLSFSTKVTEANLPSEASIELPKVHVSAEYVQDSNTSVEGQFGDGVVLRQGNYLSAVADIGVFEHSLTTDLLNHLVFVQKVFMKEVNEVVQKVYGGEKPVPLWEDDSDHPNSNIKRILFSLVIRLKRIQLTAVTPTNCAVRLETGGVDLQLSNRVQNVSGQAKPSTSMKLFAKASVDVNLSLGQLIKNALFEEAEPEFQQYAFFKTRIVVLITLRRPLIYIQPLGVDKAILVWLNYKNAYEYWNEQRSSLNKEVLTATQQVFEKMPFDKLTGPPFLGTLFLQLTVEDMGICVPLNPLPPPTWGRQVYTEDSCSAVVVTLESTSISACSWGSLVSKARFVGLCLRFADDFETSLDDWKPEPSEPAMNLCVVSEGTYEICSRTVAAQKIDSDNAKWFLNVQWAMQGVDIHLDVNVGKQLSALGHTLTMLTGYQEDDVPNPSYDSDDADVVDNPDNSQESLLMRRPRVPTFDSLPAFAFDPSLDSKKRAKLIEKEMNEQAKIINDLRSLGASQSTIEQEMKRLKELEHLIFKDFRRDMIQRWRKSSVRTSSNKKKMMSSKSTTFRSRSFIVPSPTPENHLEMDSPDNDGSSFSSSPPTALFSRTRTATSPRVTFSDSHNFTRQSSLPSASSELSLPIEGDFMVWQSDRHSTDNLPPHSEYTNHSTLLLGDVEGSTSGSSPSTAPAFQKPTEPNIDFELDVKVLINRGKCVLHIKDQTKEDELKMLSRMKKERSCSGGMFEFPPSSPGLSRRSQRQHSSTPAARLRHAQSAPLHTDVTIFHIPGLDVKVHYESKTLADILRLETLPGQRRSGTKKASLFAWMTLQSIPEETIISPHILDFLEQTLEPIPTQEKSPSFQTGGPNTVQYYYYASFPVDVIVYFHMQPSTFRSSLPGAMGGLSVTSCLSDFSLYIFHPYGGKKSGMKEAQWSPLSDTIVDIGSASFKYDMRRLTEILAFPKAWYRRTIMRRLFLGDLSTRTTYSDGDESDIGVRSVD